MNKQTKYQEYKRKARQLDEILSIANGGSHSLTTIENLPFTGFNTRVEQLKNKGGALVSVYKDHWYWERKEKNKEKK